MNPFDGVSVPYEGDGVYGESDDYDGPENAALDEGRYGQRKRERLADPDYRAAYDSAVVCVDSDDLKAILDAASEPLDWPQPGFPMEAYDRLRASVR